MEQCASCEGGGQILTAFLPFACALSRCTGEAGGDARLVLGLIGLFTCICSKSPALSRAQFIVLEVELKTCAAATCAGLKLHKHFLGVVHQAVTQGWKTHTQQVR